MIRFVNGEPQAIWYSQHTDGEAFTYAATEKQGVRPVVYSAVNSHANYATTGTHDHTIPGLNLPFGPVEDHCNQGTLWDPTLSTYTYAYTPASRSSTGQQTFVAYNGADPVNWLYFLGQWGDEQYPASHPGQEIIFGEAKYSGGPTGPIDKNLERTNVCKNDGDCNVSPILTP